MSLEFPRTARVRSRAEFDRIFQHGRRTGAPTLALHWLERGDVPRLGLAVSRKVSAHAVVRNRIKRALRDEFRHIRANLPPGDYVVVARPGAAAREGPALREDFRAVLVRAGALPPSTAGGTMPPAAPLPDSAPDPAPDSCGR